MQIEHGDILFLRGTSVLSRLIRLRSESVYSHVGIAVRLPSPFEGLYVIEAVEPIGVRLVPFRVWELWGSPIDVYRPRLTLPQRDVMVRHAIRTLGCRYASWRQFVRSWGVIGRRIAKAIGLPADTDGKRFFCSELVADSLRYAGAHLHASPSRMSPGDVSLLSCLQHEGRLFP